MCIYFGLKSSCFTHWCAIGIFIILPFEEKVIKKRREALKKEKELEHIQAKRNLDFLDILLFAKVSFFSLENHAVLKN